MSKRILATVIVVLFIGMAIAPIVSAANITNAQADDVTMDGGDTITHDVTVTNDGDNSTAADVTIDTSPTGVSVSQDGSTTLSANTDTDVPLEIDADSDASSGEVSGDVNGESFSFDLTVETGVEPGFAEEPLNVGDILVGEEDSGTVEVVDQSGNDDLNGIDWTIVNDDSDGTLSFDDLSTISGDGGSATWTVDVDSNADQHQDLSWTVELEDQATGDTEEVDVEARVIYSGYIDDLSLSGNVEFDEPRDQTDEITKEIELEVENAGDESLDLDGASVSASDTGISATAEDIPGSVSSSSSDDITIEVTADTDLSEGDYDISGSVDADNEPAADVDDSVDDSFRIDHGTELQADTIAIGDVPVGESGSGTTEVEETLGYNDLEDIEFERVEGPDQWITQQQSFSSLDAQESDTVGFGIEFDTSADIGNQYEWEYEISGDTDNTNVPTTETVTITATPIPLNLEPIIESLSDHDGTVADETIDVIEDTDERIRAGTGDDAEISSALAFGDSAELYLESTGEASALLDEGNNEDAQREIIRAASSYNSMVVHGDNINSPAVGQVLSTAESDVDELVEDQTEYYEGQLDEGDMTLLEEANIKGQLAQLERLSGNPDRASQLDEESDEAFDEYVETVSQAEQFAQDGDEVWNEMQQEEFVTVIGQPLLLNPMKFTSVRGQINEFDESYSDAISALETAGATSRADTVGSEYSSRSTSLLLAQASLFIVFGLLIGGIIGVIGWTTRQMYRYAEDTQETVMGDFLVA